MARKYAGQNNAANYALISANPEYQQRVFLYDNLASALAKDFRTGLDKKFMKNLSRAKNLVNAESTALFDPKLMQLQEFYKQYPNLEGAPLDTAKKLALSPIGVQDSQFRQVRGWNGAEVHHNVGVAGIADQTSWLPYDQWGFALQNAGKIVPITTQVFNGTGNRSGPGHNLSHLDLFSGQFYKGGDVGAFAKIVPDETSESQVAQVLDAAKSMQLISRIGGVADEQLFLPILAEKMSEKAGRRINPSELSSSLVSPYGQGASEAAIAYSYSDEKMVAEATREAYGSDNAVEGAANYLNSTARYPILATAEELKERKNAKARSERKRRKMGLPLQTENTQSIIVRPDHMIMANKLGINTDKVRFI